MDDELLIEAGPFQTRIALIEDGRLVQLDIADPDDAGPLLGTVWLGRVTRVLPAIQAAFVEVGLARAGFLAAADARGLKAGETRIERLVHEGQAVPVQAVKEPIGEKGVKLTTAIALPGRYLVLTPGRPGLSVSRRIGDAAERARLEGALAPLLGDDGGILRTAAEGADAALLAADVARLKAVAADIAWRQTSAQAPTELWRDIGQVERALRDLAGPRVARIRIDGAETFARARAWARAAAPELDSRLERFDGPGALFDLHDVESEIARALAPRVDLPSGGAIRFGATAALTAIDVDTGRQTGGRDFARTALTTNREAAREIARQIRLRGIGGLIVIDFVHADQPGAPAETVAELRAALAHDPAPLRVLPMSELGLVEMTRRRTGESLEARLTEACTTCEGRGRRPTVRAVLAGLGHRLITEARARPGLPLTVACAPEIAAALEGEAAERLARRIGARIAVAADAARPRDAIDVRLG